jgi:hypothetical protein
MLTPKGRRSFFSKKCSNLPFLAQEAKMKQKYFFGILTVGSCLRLLGEYVEKVLKKVEHTDCEIITFEVERKVFFACARQGQQTLTACGAKILNYATLSFCIIIMHIMLGTCVPNLRG